MCKLPKSKPDPRSWQCWCLYGADGILQATMPPCAERYLKTAIKALKTKTVQIRNVRIYSARFD